MINTDMDLVRDYAQNNSEASFSALVSRHINMVYSVAMRQVGDAHLAEDVTQAVFIILARKANSLDSKTVLSGWLCRTARYASADALKMQRRRENREQEAYMQAVLNETDPAGESWTLIAPLLDAALGQLGRKDHDALVLRYFEGKSLKEVGVVLGASEDAAKMRVSRALEKLRKFFSKRGVVSTTAVIAGMISANSVQAAPGALAGSVTAIAAGKGIAAGGSTIALVKGSLKLMAWAKAKTAITIGFAVFLIAGTTATLVIDRQLHPRPQPTAARQKEFPKASWAFAGYATPEDALQSMFWALREGNVKVLMSSLTPWAESETKADIQRANREDIEMGLAKVSEDNVFRKMAEELAKSRYLGYRILEKEVKSEDEVIIRIAMRGGKNKTDDFRIKRAGNDWRVNELPW